MNPRLCHTEEYRHALILFSSRKMFSAKLLIAENKEFGAAVNPPRRKNEGDLSQSDT